jgi:hypothetical protein
MRRGEFITLVARWGRKEGTGCGAVMIMCPTIQSTTNGWRTSPAIAAGSIAAVHESAYAELWSLLSREALMRGSAVKR